MKCYKRSKKDLIKFTIYYIRKFNMIDEYDDSDCHMLAEELSYELADKFNIDIDKIINKIKNETD